MTKAAPIEVPPAVLEIPLDAFEVTADKRYVVAGKTSKSTAAFEVHGKPVVVPDDTFGSALQLNGKDTWVDVGPVVDALAGAAASTAAFSVSLWVKPARARPGNRTLVSVSDAWQLDLEKSKPRFVVEALDPSKVKASVEKALDKFEQLQAKAEKLEQEAAETAVQAAIVESVAAAQENMLEAVADEVGSEAEQAEIEADLLAAQAETEKVREAADALLVKATKARQQADAKAKPIAAAPETISATSKDTALVKQSWMHIVGVYDGQGVRLYVDGLQTAELDLGATQSEIRYGPTARLAIGVDAVQKKKFFEGQLARVQYFAEALSSEKVVALRSADLSFRAAFQGRYPFDFDLVDVETQARNVVYIADVGTRKAKVTLTNTASAPLSLNKPVVSAALGANNHHFELRFRPDTFAVRQEGVPALTVEAKGWQSATAPSPDGLSTSVYMVWAGKSKKVLQPGQQVVFDLEYQSASGQMGSRGTNVVLGYRNLTWQTKDHSQIDVGGERISNIDVISRSGRETVPLNVGFVGTNRVLNVDPKTAEASVSTGSLKIRIGNNQQADPLRPELSHIRFRSIKDQAGADADAATKFTVSFATTGDAALTNSLRDGDAGAGMYLRWRTVAAGEDVVSKDLAVNRLGGKATWTFNPDVSVLRPGEYFEIEMHGITTTAPSGPADIYIHYEDIPGYWDGQFTVTAEKSPLVYRHKQVGIGRYPKNDGRDGALTVGHLKVERIIELTHDSGGDWEIRNNRFEGGTNQMAFNIGGETAVRVYDSGDLRIHGTLISEDLTVTGRAMIESGTIQRGGTRLSGSQNDLGLYQGHKNAWMRFVTNSGPIKFFTDGGYGKKEKLTIQSDGSVVAKGTVKAATVEVERFLTLRNQDWPSWEIRHNQIGNYGVLAFGNKNGTAFQIHQDGRVKHLGGSWSGSDARLKTDIEDISDPLAILQRFRPRSFRWASSGQPDLGFVAQEVEQVVPEMVDASDDIRTVAYNQFITLAVGAIQQQQEQIEALRATLKDMEAHSNVR